jgi:hypothetical protein
MVEVPALFGCANHNHFSTSMDWIPITAAGFTRDPRRAVLAGVIAARQRRIQLRYPASAALFAAGCEAGRSQSSCAEEGSLKKEHQGEGAAWRTQLAGKAKA